MSVRFAPAISETDVVLDLVECRIEGAELVANALDGGSHVGPVAARPLACDEAFMAGGHRWRGSIASTLLVTVLSFRARACKFGLEGVISKRADRPYAPGDRGIWVKSKCLNREEFVVVGWTDPERSRSHIGALLLGYFTEDGRLLYAGRAGTGMTEKELKRLAGVLAPLWCRGCRWPSHRRVTAASARR